MRSLQPPIFQFLEQRVLLSNYFVSPNGSDSASGDAAHPWRTLQKAADSALAGDLITVRAGSYAGFVMGWDGPQAGTAAKPITFHAEDGVVITSRNNRTPDGINLEPGCHWIVIEGFTVNNASGNITRGGIRIVSSDHVIVRNNRTDSNGTWGIFTSFADDILIEKNETSRSVREHGIYHSNSGDRAIIRNNHVWGNNANGIHMNGDLSQGGDGIISSALVTGNIIHDNGVAGGSGINCDGVQNSRIENNLLYNNHASAISLYRIDGAQGSKNNTIVNNTIVQASDARWAINIKNDSTGARVFNNILYSHHSFRGSINILDDSRNGFASDYNVVMSRFSTNDGDSVISLAQWRSATGQDLHSIVSTPATLFANAAQNDYHLSQNSPAIDAGLDEVAPSTDRDGITRPLGLGADIGAFEFESGVGRWRQTTLGDFAGGHNSGTLVTNVDGGEIQLAPLLSDGFGRSKLSAAWMSRTRTDTGTVSLSSGRLLLTGAEISSVDDVRGLPVRARLAFAAAPLQRFGLGTALGKASSNTWAVFTTKDSGTALCAQVNVAGNIQEVVLGQAPGGMHSYEVRPGPNGFVFFIDGRRRATILAAPPAVPMHLFLSSGSIAQLTLDSAQVLGYRPAGLFNSSVFDAGQVVSWNQVDWDSSLPAGSSLVVEVSTGSTATPDASWTPLTAVTKGNLSNLSSRFIRYRVRLNSPGRIVTPVFSEISIRWQE